MALEPEFWRVLEDLAATRGLTLAALIRTLDADRADRPLASACRLAALAFAKAASRDRPDPSSLG